jgi:hypothetical protein
LRYNAATVAILPSNRTSHEVLNAAKSTLQHAQIALEDIRSTEPRRVERWMKEAAAVITLGRSVTFILQNLRQRVGEQAFEEWYEPWRTEMESDPLLKALCKLRNQIEKRGKTGANARVMVCRSDTPDPRGPSFHTHHIEFDDCTPYQGVAGEGILSTQFVFEGLPTEHLGKPIENCRVEHVCHLYVLYLEQLLDAAERRFR